MGKYIDISLKLSDRLPFWPGDEPFSHYVTSEIGKDESLCNVSAVRMSTHFGTHVDSSYHFYDDGLKISEIEPDILCGQCQIIEVISDSGYIERKHVANLLKPGIKRLLVKTGNSELLVEKKFYKNYTAFSLDCIEYIVDNGINMIGFDYFSIARFDEGELIHKAFFKNRGVVALEGIYLGDVEPGFYEIFCLPLKIKDSGGAPARAVLKIK